MKDLHPAGVENSTLLLYHAFYTCKQKDLDLFTSIMNSFHLKIKKKDDITQKLIENMIEELYELEEQYPQNIRVKEDNNE